MTWTGAATGQEGTARAGLTPGVIAIVRLHKVAAPDELLSAITAGGVRSVEVTLPTPGSTDSIARWSRTPGIAVGAGTVRTADDVARAADAGAQFLVTPATSRAVLSAAQERGIPVVCGALTPTEIEVASELGAEWVKVFPINSVGGLDYLNAIGAPLPLDRLVPTGGINAGNAADYAAAGCAGIGVGSSLVDEATVRAGDWATITERSRLLSTAWADGVARRASTTSS